MDLFLTNRCGGDANVMVYYGEACLLDGDHENADRIFGPLLDSPNKSSWNPSTQALLGYYIMERKTRWQEAMELFESVREEANWKCNLLFGEWSRRIGDYRSAISAFVDCLRLCPADLWARVRLVYCYWKCGALDECVQEYDIMVRQHECVDTLLCYADMLRLTGKDYDKAMQLFGKAQGMLGDEFWWIKVRIGYCEHAKRGSRELMEDFFNVANVLQEVSGEIMSHKDDWSAQYKADLEITAAIGIAKTCGYSYNFNEGDDTEWMFDAVFLSPSFKTGSPYAGSKMLGYWRVLTGTSNDDTVTILKNVLEIEPSDGKNWLMLAKAHVLNDNFEEVFYHYRVALRMARSGNDLPFLKEVLIYGCKIHFHFSLWDCFDESLPLMEHDKEFLVWHAFMNCDENCVDEASEILFMANVGDEDDTELRYYAGLVHGRIDVMKGDGNSALNNANALMDEGKFPGFGSDHAEGYALGALANMLLKNVDECKKMIGLALNKLNTLSGHPRLIHWVFAAVLACYVDMDMLEDAKRVYDRWKSGGVKTGIGYDYQVWCYAGMMFSKMDGDENKELALQNLGHSCRVNRRHYLSRWQLGLHFEKQMNDKATAKKCLVNALACIENNTAGAALDDVAAKIRNDLNRL